MSNWPGLSLADLAWIVFANTLKIPSRCVLRYISNTVFWLIICFWYGFSTLYKYVSFQTQSLQASGFHSTLVWVEYWTRIDLQTICDVTNHARRCTSQWAQTNFPLSADECDNSRLLSNPAHISFRTVKLKHLTGGTGRKNIFLTGGGL